MENIFDDFDLDIQKVGGYIGIESANATDSCQTLALTCPSECQTCISKDIQKTCDCTKGCTQTCDTTCGCPVTASCKPPCGVNTK